MASVAAGSRLSGNRRFVGAAPDCNIVVVKLKPIKQYLREYYLIPEDVPCYQETDLIQAIQYLQKFAVSLYSPLVICLGVGTNLGAHSGVSVFARYLDLVMGRKSRAAVTCAGNEGNAAHHYEGGSRAGQTESVEIRVDERENGFTMELWGKIPDRHAISIRTPGGEVTPQVDFRERDVREFSFVYESTKIQVGHILVEQRSGEELIFFRFLDPAPGVFTIYVTAMGTGSQENQDSFHMWLPLKEFLRGETYFLRPTPYTTILEPGNAREIITVSAYDDRNGRGYTRQGLIKPDFAAPGVSISTALGKGTGTSLSAAISAGAAAQFLQWAIVEENQPWVGNREIRNYLIRGARRQSVSEGTYRIYPNKEEGDNGIIVSDQASQGNHNPEPAAFSGKIIKGIMFFAESHNGARSNSVSDPGGNGQSVSSESNGPLVRIFNLKHEGRFVDTADDNFPLLFRERRTGLYGIFQGVGKTDGKLG